MEVWDLHFLGDIPRILGLATVFSGGRAQKKTDVFVQMSKSEISPIRAQNKTEWSRQDAIILVISGPKHMSHKKIVLLKLREILEVLDLHFLGRASLPFSSI